MSRREINNLGSAACDRFLLGSAQVEESAMLLPLQLKAIPYALLR